MGMNCMHYSGIAPNTLDLNLKLLSIVQREAGEGQLHHPDVRKPVAGTLKAATFLTRHATNESGNLNDATATAKQSTPAVH